MRRLRFEVAFSIILLAWCALFVHRSRVTAWPEGTERTACLFDDAMIGMRYAENLARGHDLVWNPGENVEGYTNFLWVLVMTLPHLVTEDRALACHLVQILGIVLALGIAWTARALALRLTGSPLVARVAMMLAGSYYPLLYWSLMGMETGLAALCVTAAATDLAGRTAHPRLLWLYPLLSAAGVLARPDLALVAALFLAIRAAGLRGTGAFRNVLPEGALFALPVGAHLLWRHATYGEWLPNTYVLKVDGLPAALRLENGLAYSLPYWKTLGVPALALLAGLVAGIPIRAAALLAPVAALHLYQVWVGGDPWPLWRFTAPVFPILAVVLAVSLDAASRRFAPASGAARFLPPRRIALAAGTVLVFAGLHAGSLDRLRIRRIFQKWDNQVNVWRARAIHDVAAPDAVVACFWAGAIPYFTGLPAADFLGKMDPHIARLPPDETGAVSWDGIRSVPGHNKYDLAWTVATYKPDIIADAHVRWGRERLDEDPGFLSRYTKVRHAAFPEEAGATAAFWVRRDSPRIRRERLVLSD